MSKVIKVKKGLDINLKGKAERIITQANESATFAIKPTDFVGVVAKVAVKEGDEVKVGSPLFFSKDVPEMKFTSPASGKVIAVKRGERRKLLEIVVESDKKFESLSFKSGNPQTMNREEVIATLLESGLWAFFKQRPYSIVANPKDMPKAIFVSSFDSAPLAPDYSFVLKEEKASFQFGLNVLRRLTEGKVYLGVNSARSSEDTFMGMNDVEIVEFQGPHPVGNVGVQINKIDPINKNEIVWTINPQDLVLIGRLFETGKVDYSKVVALVGSEVNKPQYFKTRLGAEVSSLTNGNISGENVRIISGNVLTGEAVAADSFVGFYDSMVTVIKEGNEPEFMGWIAPGFGKFSFSRTFFSWLCPKKEYTLDTNLHGGERAFVFTGAYERVLPMDIYPMQLLKAIIAEDVDKMEQLGIYEVAEEDFALCEFICPSKIEIQSIIRKGLDLVRKEFN